MKSYNHLYEKAISDEIYKEGSEDSQERQAYDLWHTTDDVLSRVAELYRYLQDVRGQDKTLYKFSKVQAACVRLR